MRDVPLGRGKSGRPTKWQRWHQGYIENVPVFQPLKRNRKKKAASSSAKKTKRKRTIPDTASKHFRYQYGNRRDCSLEKFHILNLAGRPKHPLRPNGPKWTSEEVTSAKLAADAIASKELVVSATFAGRQINIQKFIFIKELISTIPGVTRGCPLMKAIDDAIEDTKNREAHHGDKIIEEHYQKIIQMLLAHPSKFDVHRIERIMAHPVKAAFSIEEGIITSWPSTLVAPAEVPKTDVWLRIKDVSKLSLREQNINLVYLQFVRDTVEWLLDKNIKAIWQDQPGSCQTITKWLSEMLIEPASKSGSSSSSSSGGAASVF
jgi:hypothetical protein